MTKQLAILCLLLVCLASVAGIRAFADDLDTGSMPGTFTFSAVCGQAPEVLVESGSITVTDIAEPVPISVAAGEYSINGGSYTSEPGLVSFGQTVSVRHVTATGAESMKSSILTVGGLSAVFTSSTEPCLQGTR